MNMFFPIEIPPETGSQNLISRQHSLPDLSLPKR
jgi:hypothetical protein